MSNTIYVGNLSWKATEEDLTAFFSPIGTVESARVIRDRESGRSKGFAFVTMDNTEKAITDLDGKEVCGRPVRLSPAREREPR